MTPSCTISRYRYWTTSSSLAFLTTECCRHKHICIYINIRISYKNGTENVLRHVNMVVTQHTTGHKNICKIKKMVCKNTFCTQTGHNTTHTNIQKFTYNPLVRYTKCTHTRTQTCQKYMQSQKKRCAKHVFNTTQNTQIFQHTNINTHISTHKNTKSVLARGFLFIQLYTKHIKSICKVKKNICKTHFYTNTKPPNL